MEHLVKVTQTLRVARTTMLAIEAASIEEAIEAVANGAIDLPPGDVRADTPWSIARSSLEHEAYDAA